jgi:hypothetical protein
MKLQLLAATAIAFLAACHGPSLDVGSSVDSGTNPIADAGAGASSITTWTGYFESFHLPSGSDHVTLKLAFAADGTVTGTALLGDLPLLKPPTNPDVGYPPPILPDGGGPPNALEHFEFTIRDGRVDGSRFTFRLHMSEVWTSWCQLQTKVYPFLNGGNGELLGYACIPNSSVSGGVQGGPGRFWRDDATNVDVPIDCNKLDLCKFGGPCSCTATNCTVDPNADDFVMRFDMHLSDTSADGTADGFQAPAPVTVHLVKK